MLALTISLRSSAQAPAWQSALALSQPPSISNAFALAANASGDIYIAGSFSNSIVLGSTSLTSNGNSDIYVAKWSRASNSFVWAVRAGGIGTDEVYALTVNGSNIYIAGVFDGVTASFGGTTLRSQGQYDTFITKLTDTGTTASFVWALSAGGEKWDIARGLAVSGTSVYLVGSFEGSSITFGNTTLLNPSGPYSTDAYIVKLTDTGTTGAFVWAQSAGGYGFDNATAVAVQGNSLYVTGSFERADARFGSTTLFNAGRNDVFVAKLLDAGPTGSFVWAQSSGNSGSDLAAGLVVQGTSLYIIGSFTSSTLSFGATTIVNGGYDGADGFVAKLTDTGSRGDFVWAQDIGGQGGNNDELLQAVALNGAGVCVLGRFGSPTLHLGSTLLRNASTATLNGGDIFVTQLDDTGSSARFAWAQRGGGPDDDYGRAMQVVGADIYVAGGVAGVAEFGKLPPIGSPSSYSGFLARLGLPPTVRISGDTLICPGGQLTLTATPSVQATAYKWNTGAVTQTITITQSGTYTVTATFTGGGTATATYRVAGLQAFVRITGDTVLCAGATGQLNAVAPGASTIEWSGGSQTASLLVNQPGVYRVTAHYGAGCTATAQVTVKAPSVQIAGPTQVCLGGSNSIQLSAVAPGATAFQWSTGATTAALSVTQPGTYTVTATFGSGCTLATSHVVGVPVASIVGDSLLCPGSSLQLTASGAAGSSYAWSTGDTSASISVSRPGTYSVLVTYAGGCTSQGQRTVQARLANPPFSLGADTTICEGSTLLLHVPASSDPAVTYRWSNGSTAATLLVQAEGVYTLGRRSACGTQSASRHILFRSCQFIPNVVTPDGDGKNDRFEPAGLVGEWSLEVYNRWGQRIYVTDRYQGSWGDVTAGTYFYLLRQATTQQLLRGWVDVIR